MNNAAKWIKAAVALTALAIVFFLVMGWLNDYRAATKETLSQDPESAAATATVDPDAEKAKEESPAESAAEKPAAKPKVLIVKIDGLNFRKVAEPDGTPIRGLKKGDKLTLVKTEGSWYLVKDADGVQGYISSNPQYTSVEK